MSIFSCQKMTTPHADTTWRPWRHRGAFERVGAPGVVILLGVVRPQTIHQAEQSRTAISRHRFVRYKWRVFDTLGPIQREFERPIIQAWGYPLSPWTVPTIHDVGDVLEVLIRWWSSPPLLEAMGEVMKSWEEGAGPEMADSDWSEE